MAAIRIVIGSENNGATLRQTGSLLPPFEQGPSTMAGRAIQFVNLFGYGAGKCRVWRFEGQTARMEEGSEYIFSRLASAWRRGHRDEAMRLAACLALRAGLPPSLRSAALRGAAVFEVADEAELTILRVACRVALFAIHGHEPDGDRRDEDGLHQTLGALKEGRHVRILSASDIAEVPDFARSFVIDSIQLHSNPPPLGLIPNNDYLCYAASVLTLILSIPEVVRGLSMYAGKSAFVSVMLEYDRFLRSGCYSREDCGHLNAYMLSLPEFRQFDRHSADDSLKYACSLLEGFARWAPEVAAMFGEIAVVPSLLEAGVREPSVELPASPLSYTLDYDLDERESREAGAVSWEASYIERPITFAPHAAPPPSLQVLYAPRDGSRNMTGPFEDFVETALDGARPRILLICHGIRSAEIPATFVIPCSLRLPARSSGEALFQYSNHGVVLHDNRYSEGHYISMIISNTSMFFYDPQHEDGVEDPRVYRPRILCYIRVDKPPALLD
jgi:hypothetical protein